MMLGVRSLTTAFCVATCIISSGVDVSSASQTSDDAFLSRLKEQRLRRERNILLLQSLQSQLDTVRVGIDASPEGTLGTAAPQITTTTEHASAADIVGEAASPTASADVLNDSAEMQREIPEDSPVHDMWSDFSVDEYAPETR